MTPAEIRPARLLGGNDLIGLGFEPGPRFKAILKEVEDLQLDGTLVSREQAVEYVLNHYAPSGNSPHAA